MKTFEIKEKTTAIYTATLKDENKVVIPLVDLTTLTLTLYNEEDVALSVVNGRSGQSILNENGGVFHDSSGLLTLTLGVGDTAMVDSTKDRERHRLQIDFTYSVGAKAGRHECVLLILGAPKVS